MKPFMLLRALRLPGAFLVLALASAAGAETFHKWETPGGTVYIGDTPPPGSVLLDSIELPDAEELSAEDRTARLEARASAAADGREIMLRRAAEREADRERRSLVVERIVEREPERTTLIVTHRPDHLFDFVPPGGIARSLRDEGIGSVQRVPAPVAGPTLPPSRPGHTALVPVAPRFHPAQPHRAAPRFGKSGHVHGKPFAGFRRLGNDRSGSARR